MQKVFGAIMISAVALTASTAFAQDDVPFYVESAPIIEREDFEKPEGNNFNIISRAFEALTGIDAKTTVNEKWLQNHAAGREYEQGGNGL